MKFVLTDGGRAEAGYKGTAGDCVVRSIAIAACLTYQQVYDDLFSLSKAYAREHKNKYSRGGTSPRNGVHRKVYEPYLTSLGFKWHPTMSVGQGCKVHLREDELPSGNLVVSLSRHITCVVDGVIYDTYDPSRNGTRCVYGYYKQK